MTETVQLGDREPLIHENQGLVRHLAQQVRCQLPAWIEMDDLVSYGQVGLLQAARDFDPDRNVKFSTFAYYRIRGAIFDGVNKLMWFKAVRDPVTKFNQLANSVIPAKVNESPTADTSSHEGLTHEASWFSQLASSLAIVYLAAADEQGHTKDVIDDSVQSPWANLVQGETSTKLREAIEELPPDAAALIRAVYYEDRTLQEAGDRLGISKSWASRMHTRALEQMARYMKNWENEAPA